MINPPPLPERVEPTVCLIKPKGRDRAGHTARERGRQRQIGKRRKKKTLFISVPLRLPSVYRTWQLVLTSCPLRLIPLLSFHRLSFSPNDEKKRPLGLSLSLSSLSDPATHRRGLFLFPFSSFHYPIRTSSFSHFPLCSISLTPLTLETAHLILIKLSFPFPWRLH